MDVGLLRAHVRPLPGTTGRRDRDIAPFGFCQRMDYSSKLVVRSYPTFRIRCWWEKGKMGGYRYDVRDSSAFGGERGFVTVTVPMCATDGVI